MRDELCRPRLVQDRLLLNILSNASDILIYFEVLGQDSVSWAPLAFGFISFVIPSF